MLFSALHTQGFCPPLARDDVLRHRFTILFSAWYEDDDNNKVTFLLLLAATIAITQQ